MRLTFEQHAGEIANLYRAPGVGRPAGLANATLVRTLLECVAAGNYLEIAAHIVGMSKQTIYNWLKRGEQGETDGWEAGIRTLTTRISKLVTA